MFKEGPETLQKVIFGTFLRPGRPSEGNLESLKGSLAVPWASRKRWGTGDGACNYGNRRQSSFLKDVSNGITDWERAARGGGG